MHISRINQSNNLNCKAVYFIESQNVCCANQELKNKVIGITKTGINYIKDVQLSENIKEQFINSPYISSLAKNNDVFIRYNEKPIKFYDGIIKNVSFAKIIWTNYKKKFAEVFHVDGISVKSQEEARANMFLNLANKKFLEPIPSLQKIDY